MKIDIEKMDNCQVALKIEAEPDELKKSQKAAYQRLVNKVSVPGFRKGKAPQVILEQHVGREAMLDEALEHLVPELYTKAVKSQELEPIAEPQIDITQTEPVVFKAIVSLKPRVELGDYHTIKLKAEPVKVSDSDIDKAMEQVREGQAVLAPVERPVQPGDFIILDVEGSLDGKPFLSHKGITYEVNPDSKLPLPGFAEKLVGAEKSKEMTFTLRIPDDYNIENS
ncbi:MAG: trigger factor, partial [Chloroflexota bacterium]|nr:trigger factor [Chloroflexota bacterium]